MMSSWQRLSAGGHHHLHRHLAPSARLKLATRCSPNWQRFRTEPVSPDELHRAVNYLAGQTTVQRQTASAQASEIVDAYLLGSGLSELDDPAAAYRQVTAAAVQRVAATYLDPAFRAEGRVRGQ